MIEEYFENIKALLQTLALSQPPEVDYDYRDRETGFIKGDLVFKDGSRLHFPNLPTAPHHKHVGENEVVAANAPDLQ